MAADEAAWRSVASISWAASSSCVRTSRRIPGLSSSDTAYHPLGSRLAALGSRFWVPGSRFEVLGARRSAVLSRLSARGSRLSLARFQDQVPPAIHMIRRPFRNEGARAGEHDQGRPPKRGADLQRRRGELEDAVDIGPLCLSRCGGVPLLFSCECRLKRPVQRDGGGPVLQDGEKAGHANALRRRPDAVRALGEGVIPLNARADRFGRVLYRQHVLVGGLSPAEDQRQA